MSDSVDELVILALLRQMTISDQITASQVCFRWRRLAKEVTKKRAFLAIMVKTVVHNDSNWERGPEDFEDRSAAQLRHGNGSSLYPLVAITKWNSIVLEGNLRIDEIHFDKIANSFTGIKDLTICFAHVPFFYLTLINNILTNWQQQLTSLKVVERMPRAPNVGNQFFEIINDMPALASLHLDLAQLVVSNIDQVITRLARLYFHSIRTTPAQFAALLERALQQCPGREGPGLAITFRHDRFLGQNRENPAHPDPIQVFDRLGDDIRGHFVRFIMNLRPVDDIELLRTRFPSITRLSLSLNNSPLRPLYRRLHELHHLIMLRLNIDFGALVWLGDDDPNDDAPPSLNSIHGLSLHVSRMNSHNNLNLLHIPEVMPRLQVAALHLAHGSSCFECNILQTGFDNSFRLDENQLNIRRQCFSTMLRQLITEARRQQLLAGANDMHLFYSHQKKYGLPEEILAD